MAAPEVRRKRKRIPRCIGRTDVNRAIRCPRCTAPMMVVTADYHEVGQSGDVVEARVKLFCICEAR